MEKKYAEVNAIEVNTFFDRAMAVWERNGRKKYDTEIIERMKWAIRNGHTHHAKNLSYFIK